MAAAVAPPAGQVYPVAADLRRLMTENPLPAIAPGTVDPVSVAGEGAINQVHAVLDKLNDALTNKDGKALVKIFFPGQAYWKDSLALTYHLRTFTTPSVIATGLLETIQLRGITESLKPQGEALFNPILQFIACDFTFRTGSPAASCTGKIFLFPIKDDSGAVEWKIWVLSTRLANLDVHPENEALLRTPGKQIDGKDIIDTDVFIIGGGNAAVALAARLKALGIDYVVAERNPKPGDNWALRYDALKFHVPTSFCTLPYLPYADEFRTRLLSRDDLAAQVQRYVSEFNLNVITEAKIQSTTYDPASKRWTVTFHTPAGSKTAVAKHLVQATGIGSQVAYVPEIEDKDTYKGVNLHSAEYKNPAGLKAKGVESVLVIGSANTAFDILADTQAAGLKPTILVRTPTYIVPVEYVTDPNSLGVYDFGVEAADRLLLSLPVIVDAALGKGFFTMRALAEPDRYKPLSDAGFPVLDSAHPEQALMHNLIERCGGHYVDIGATDLIVQGKVGVKANAEPVGYTERGLRLSDGSTVEADAILWCTGFRDTDATKVVTDILGAEPEGDKGAVLGPKDVADHMDATWGIDAEGEVRGMWKRHLRLDNFWVMGGYTQQHRYHSLTLALQIKAELEGILPEAYRATPAATF